MGLLTPTTQQPIVSNPALNQATNYNRGNPTPSAGSQAAPLFNNLPTDPAYLTQNLSRSNPLPWQQYFSPNVVDTNNPDSLASQQLGRGEDYFKSITGYGVNQAGTPNFQTRSLTGGGSTVGNAQADAISRKYSQDAQANLQNIRTQRNQNAPLEYSNQQKTAGQLLATSQGLDLKNFQDQYNFQMQRYNLYNQWLAAKNGASSNFIANAISIGAAVAPYAVAAAAA